MNPSLACGGIEFYFRAREKFAQRDILNFAELKVRYANFLSPSLLSRVCVSETHVYLRVMYARARAVHLTIISVHWF